jgi:hypothetical protein
MARRRADDGRRGVKLYPRDHTWQNSRPGTTHGAYALHAQSSLADGLAACDSRIILDVTRPVYLREAGERVCRRVGCRAAIRAVSA